MQVSRCVAWAGLYIAKITPHWRLFRLHESVACFGWHQVRELCEFFLVDAARVWLVWSAGSITVRRAYEDRIQRSHAVVWTLLVSLLSSGDVFQSCDVKPSVQLRVVQPLLAPALLYLEDQFLTQVHFACQDLRWCKARCVSEHSLLLEHNLADACQDGVD